MLFYTPKGFLSTAPSGSTIERKFDVIILRTGFNAAGYLEYADVRGREGRELKVQWKEHPEAFWDVGVRKKKIPFLFLSPFHR